MNSGNGLPLGWTGTTLGDVVEINPRLDLTESPDAALVSFVPMAAVEAGTGRVDLSATRPLNEVRRGYTAFRDGDVIFAKITPCMENGKAAVVSQAVSGIAFGSTEFHVLRPPTGIDPRFLYFYVAQESFRQDARRQMTGTAGQLRVPTRYLEGVAFPLVPRAEQRRIVAAVEQQFTRLDAGVAALKRAQARLKRYRASVLKAAVEGELTAEWRAAHPATETGAELLRRILAERRARWEADLRAKGKDPAKAQYAEPAGPDMGGLPELPPGWCITNLTQTASQVRYGSSAKTSVDSSGVPVLRMGNIRDGSLDLTDLKYLPSDHSEFPGLLLQPGDLLFNRTNSPELVGKSAVYQGEPSPCSFASYLIGSRMLPGCSADYICFFLNSNYGKAWVARVVTQQVGQANVNGTKLQAMAFPLPPLQEQHQIVAEVERRISVVTAFEASIEANLQRAERLRQSILREAFAGRLVAQDSNDEPASVLLERIQAARTEPRPARGRRNSSRRPELWDAHAAGS